MAEPDSGQSSSEKPIDVYEALASMLDFFSSIAWQKMGLHPDLATGKIVKDMAQAKVAVDVSASLAGFLEPALDDDADRRRVQNLVRDLRINYVEKAGGDK
ncbi:MAG TPA: DUF1844 domain-containing protein [Fimbriimonadaceae bacterium]|nr:DUF1844 domain-containing protein [Fimbriimonadaceae bacterium]